MSYWILPISGIPISCVTVQRLTNLEQNTREYQQKMDDYDIKIKERLTIKDSHVPQFDGITFTDWRLSLNSDPEFLEAYKNVIDSPLVPQQDDVQVNDNKESFNYVGMEVGLPRGSDDTLHFARVTKEVLDEEEGRPLGTSNNNPLLDGRMYEVQYLDNTTETLSANTIAENLMAQVDDNGHRQLLIDEIVDHRTTSEALTTAESLVNGPNGVPTRKKTTKGWELYVSWRDGSGNWVSLKDLKDSYPVQLAEYAIHMGIDKEPAFV